MKENHPVSNIETLIPEGALLVSKTDINGIITYCNKAFCEITGYAESELVGKPHKLVRHPDVPAALFADMWQQIKSGNPWRGLLKNRCKNGNYYWIDANITPLIENGVTVGYVSLRYMATDEDVSATEKIFHAARNGSYVFGISEKSDLHYIIELQKRLADKICTLEKYRERNEEDLRAGSEIMSRASLEKDAHDPAVRVKIDSASQFSGDIIMTARTPSDKLHIMLADAVGHGLVAAMNLLPLSQIFYTMTKKGITISQIIEEINSKIHQLMPADRFIGAMLVSIDFREQLIQVWNGGMPTPVLVNRDGKFLQKWKSQNLPLGILDEGAFSSNVEAFHFDDDCQLFMFSDGLTEAHSPDGEQYGNERVEQLLQSTEPDGRFDRLIGSLESHLGGHHAHDDISLAMANISLADKVHAQLKSQPEITEKPDIEKHWKIKIVLCENELKYLDVVSWLTQIVSEIHATAGHSTKLYMILSELFNNALDHGILELDSSIKQGPDGYDAYLKLREERLNILARGSIEVSVEKVMLDDLSGVRIRVVDSGNGFDYSAIQSDALIHAEQEQHGRGIALVKNLASKLEYTQRGKEAIAYYVCS